MSEAATTNVTRDAHPLDAVVWNALTGKQRRFALGNDRAWRFPAAIGPFAAIADTSPASFDALRELIDADGPVALVTPDEIQPPAGFSVLRRAALLQMIWQRETAPANASEYVELTAADVPDMLALTAATQPGPFGARTIELGDYLGVRNQGKLAAMAGERMQPDGHTEISAVCVDAAFRGQGHAAGLMGSLIASIRARGDTPFLHVLTSNHVAIARYRPLGFVDRCEMHLLVMGNADSSLPA
ncbi:GNAT family N-acetyltransferase [Burkholderia stagnalis]